MTDRTYSIPGLTGPAEIRVDRWGIPHIRAASRLDAFLVQGFNAARDRLWQLDLWRKRGLGLLAADHGPGFLAQDRACRLFLYRGDMDAEWAANGPEDKQIVTAFVAGINAFVTLAETDARLMPPEFPALGLTPARWQAEDVVRIRSHALVANLASEVARARVTQAGGDVAADALRRHLSPDWTPIEVPKLDAPLPPDLLAQHLLARAEPSISPERRAATLDAAWAWTRLDDTGRVTRGAGGNPAPAAEGSNNWVVSGTRTETGRPILASDPHRAYGTPSLRYIAHLTAPGLDVIGAGEPALPGVSLGHNADLAFALTIFPADQEDLMVYETDPADPTRYRYGDGWETMRIITDYIPVRGEADQPVKLAFTRHGPVICEDAAHHRAYAVRSVWSEPGAAAYLGSLRYLDAKTAGEFTAALDHWKVPPVNQVHADTAGHIGWRVAAAVPRRANWDGLSPVPGDGRYEWDGFHPGADLPGRLDPPQGFIATANEMNLPPDYPNAQRRLGFEWSEPFRADRLHTLLAEVKPMSLDLSRRLQSDLASEPARRLLALVAARGLGHPVFVDWDRRITADSAAAALFEVWWSRHLLPGVVAALAPSPAVAALIAIGDEVSVLGALEHSAPHWTEAARDALMRDTLAAADEDCARLMGPDRAAWAWGRLHQLRFAHALGQILPEIGGRRLDVGPVPIGGSNTTVGLAEYRDTDFGIIFGASFRMVLDVGDWDRSLAINAPGQAGNPASRHYDDLTPLWAAGDCVPLLFSDEAVEAATVARIHLLPSDGFGRRT
jgi:penicillin amidase